MYSCITWLHNNDVVNCMQIAIIKCVRNDVATSTRAILSAFPQEQLTKLGGLFFSFSNFFAFFYFLFSGGRVNFWGLFVVICIPNFSYCVHSNNEHVYNLRDLYPSKNTALEKNGLVCVETKIHLTRVGITM